MPRQYHKLTVDKLIDAGQNKRLNKLRFHFDFLIHDVARLRRATIDKALKPFGITWSQWRLLVCLSQSEGGITNQRQLAASMQTTEGAVGGSLSLLSNAGYVRCRVDTGDRRQKLMFLTDHGKDVLKCSRQVAVQINREILRGVKKRDLEAAERTLRQIRYNLAQLADT